MQMRDEMNPLKLDPRNRRFYEALVDLNTTDASDDTWLDKFRLVKRILKAEGKTVIKGWRCFYTAYAGEGALPIEIAEKFFGGL